ncbi:TfoX/Sxy family protein [Ferrovibrio sp.]|uniref:TfoX/Sxy family protein n=1 Tax=Ferrovibrio sp. TaxID=1917215 RepID=UPI0025BACEBD|nr:TfoX/Sxy family protein [Ferrovibrio sp.]MBX3456543.1 TfoX/Sxy family protein [Ferrovibrio sp.]
MATDSDYLDFVAELFAPLGGVAVRRMFGGAGVYSRGVMFALVVDNTLYLKADLHSKDDFEARGMGPFVYDAKGKPISLSYWQMPPELVDDPEEAVAWARKALTVAKAQKTATPPPSRRAQPTRRRR